MPSENSDLPGMDAKTVTLRDFFAAAALQGLLSDHESHPIDFEDFARTAFAHADAMIAARESRDHGPPKRPHYL